MHPPSHSLTHSLALQATKLGFLSLLLPSLPTELGFLSLPLLVSVGSQQNVPMVGNSAPIDFPHLQQIQTQALGKNQNPSSTVCQNTAAIPVSHSQLPPFCKSQLTRDPPPPSFLHASFMAIRENKFDFSVESN